MASEEWRPAGPAVCRCCFAEGCYKDISSEYFWMGKKEVYADMLNETFNINISHSKWSGPSSTSRLICEACIARLRDAAEFKKQVVECEKTFMQHLDPATSSLQPEVECEVPAAEVKLEGVKVEKLLEDEDDFDNRMGFDDDDEDMDQPLVSLASKVPKKEQINVLDLLKGTEVVVKKKKSVMRAKEPLQKVKVKKVVRPAPPPKPDKAVPKKKETSDPYLDARLNAETLVKYTTAYPFRLEFRTLQCSYCSDYFNDPTTYRAHNEGEHRDFKVAIAFTNLPLAKALKVDISDLRCRKCPTIFDNLEDAAKHLRDVHEKSINLNVRLGLHPFKFLNGKLLCGVCDERYPGMKQLNVHVLTHCRDSICPQCGKSFSHKHALKAHMENTHIADNFICRRCKSTFSTIEDRRDHIAASYKCWDFKCSMCYEKFITYKLKEAHMAEAHEYKKKSYDCLECGQSFKGRHTYRQHYYKEHSNYRVKCPLCEKEFYSESSAKKHIEAHNNPKSYECNICSKSLKSRNKLKGHMMIHSGKKRFQCAHCDKQVIQKCNLKFHMKSRHPEVQEFTFIPLE